MADKETINANLEVAKLHVLAVFVTEAIDALTSETVHVEVVKHYIRKTTVCKTFEDFDCMVDELAYERIHGQQ